LSLTPSIFVMKWPSERSWEAVVLAALAGVMKRGFQTDGDKGTVF